MEMRREFRVSSFERKVVEKIGRFRLLKESKEKKLQRETENFSTKNGEKIRVQMPELMIYPPLFIEISAHL